jgi:hypothetical protein
LVSEDSDDVGFLFAMVHGLGNLGNFDHAACRQMFAFYDKLRTSNKILKIVSFGSPQLIPLKEWDNDPQEVFPLPDTVSVEMLFVIVISSIDADTANPKEVAYLL